MRVAATALVALTACAPARREVTPTERAVAVGLVSLGTGAAMTASRCADSTDQECEAVTMSAVAIVIGVAIASGAHAWLAYQDEPPPMPPPASVAGWMEESLPDFDPSPEPD